MVNGSNRLFLFALLWFWSLIQNSGLVREDLPGLFFVLIEKDWSLAKVLLLEACLYGWTLHRLALWLGNLGHCNWLWLGRALLNSLNLVWLDRWAWWSIWLCRLINLDVLHVAALFLNFRMTLQVHSAWKLLKRQLSVERCVVVARIQAACTKTSLSEKLLAYRLVKLRNVFFLAWRARRIFPLWLDSMLRFVFLVEVLCLLGLEAQRLIPFGLSNLQIHPFLYFCDHLTKWESRLSKALGNSRVSQDHSFRLLTHVVQNLGWNTMCSADNWCELTNSRETCMLWIVGRFSIMLLSIIVHGHLQQMGRWEAWTLRLFDFLQGRLLQSLVFELWKRLACSPALRCSHTIWLAKTVTRDWVLHRMPLLSNSLSWCWLDHHLAAIVNILL